jgi:hypothetical protein
MKRKTRTETVGGGLSCILTKERGYPSGSGPGIVVQFCTGPTTNGQDDQPQVYSDAELFKGAGQIISQVSFQDKSLGLAPWHLHDETKCKRKARLQPP